MRELRQVDSYRGRACASIGRGNPPRNVGARRIRSGTKARLSHLRRLPRRWMASFRLRLDELTTGPHEALTTPKKAAIGHAPTVVFEDVAVLRETALAIICRIAGETHALALRRLQRGSTVKHAGDHGVLVLTQEFAAERGIGGRPRARCAGVRRDRLPCGAFPHSGSRFCLAHELTIAGEPTAPRTLRRAYAPRPNRCESRRSDGLPCRGLQRPGLVFCYSHDRLRQSLPRTRT